MLRLLSPQMDLDILAERESEAEELRPVDAWGRHGADRETEAGRVPGSETDPEPAPNTSLSPRWSCTRKRHLAWPGHTHPGVHTPPWDGREGERAAGYLWKALIPASPKGL